MLTPMMSVDEELGIDTDEEEDRELKDESETNRLWLKMKPKIKRKMLKVNNGDIPKFPGTIRFVCMSDTHAVKGWELQVADGDVLLCAGDYTTIGHIDEVKEFVRVFKTLPHKHKVVISGNHEKLFDHGNWEKNFEYTMANHPTLKGQDPVEVKKLITEEPSFIYLENEGVTIHGYNVYGAPWIPYNTKPAAFSIERGRLLLEWWRKIPTNTDILMTHAPPLGFGDLSKKNKERCGCENLLNEIRSRIKPKYSVFGHIHEAYGVRTDGVTTFINTAISQGVKEEGKEFQYQIVHRSIVFDLPNKL